MKSTLPSLQTLDLLLLLPPRLKILHTQAAAKLTEAKADFGVNNTLKVEFPIRGNVTLHNHTASHLPFEVGSNQS